MPDENTQTQQGTQGAGQEHAQAHEAGQAAQDQGQGVAGAQEANTEADPVDQTDDVQALRREAASRRRALRVAEKERDQLREQIDLYDRQTVERIATGRLADPADAWLAIGSLDELRGDDGVLDEAKVGAGLDRIVQERPHWGAPRDHPNLHQGVRQSERAAPSFGQALKGGGR
jgi:hypothetical protein